MEIECFKSSPIGRLLSIDGVDGRSNRSYHHVAYVPDSLMGEPELDGETWRGVARAGRALARLDHAARHLPNPGLLRQPTLRREAQSTSALEGTFAPIEDVLAADAAEADPVGLELLEVLNYVSAADAAFRWVQQYGSLSVSLLEGVHGTLVAGTPSYSRDAGRLRTCQVAIGSPNGTIERARFVPMPPGVALEAATRDLTDWINRGGSREPVIAAAMAHYQFETLHPFNDGNGRIGRLLIVLQLMIDGLVGEPLLSVSPWFESRRSEYQDQLSRVSETGDWTTWIRFFSAGIEASALDTAERVDLLLDIQADHIARLQKARVRGGLARDIVDSLIGNPIVTIPGLARRFDKTPQGTALAVQRLVEFGILTEMSVGPRRRYIARDVYRAITAPMGSVRN